MRYRNLNWMLNVLGVLVISSMLTGCFREQPAVFYTGADYVRLQKGQTFVAPRDMVLATESVVQDKDQIILDLIRANEQLLTERSLGD